MGVAVVTGAGSGIGRAVARRFASGGAHVVCVDLEADAAEATVALVQSAGGLASACTADVSREDDCLRAAQFASTIGPLQTLCNVAGVTPSAAGVHQVDEATWDHIMAVNVKSVFLMSRACLPLFKSSGAAGAIINTASVHAFGAMPETAPYAASKGAIVALTRQMAVDLAVFGIRVVAVAPGAVDTPSSHRSAAALGTALEALFSRDRRGLGWLAQPEEIAEAIYWLSSADARCVNGTTLVADAGLLAQLPVHPLPEVRT